MSIDEKGAIDALDERALAEIRALYEAVDPVPAGLVEEIQFAMTLDALHAELAELQEMSLAGARGTAVESMTFTSSSITTMVSLTPAGPDRVRLDGWCAPGAGVSVELRQGSESLTVQADADGRFVFESVPHGMTRLVVRWPGDAERAPVYTPGFEI